MNINDYWYFYLSDPCLYVGGYYDQYTDFGLFYVGRASTSDAGSIIGCRLMEI